MSLFKCNWIDSFCGLKDNFQPSVANDFVRNKKILIFLKSVNKSGQVQCHNLQCKEYMQLTVTKPCIYAEFWTSSHAVKLLFSIHYIIFTRSSSIYFQIFFKKESIPKINWKYKCVLFSRHWQNHYLYSITFLTPQEKIIIKFFYKIE